jgi:hypothetical protein
MNVVYLAGGLNTRFEELAIFPKILLPVDGNDSILIKNMKTFAICEQYLVINERFVPMVEEYCNLNNLQIKIIPTTNTFGSYNTLKEIYNDLPVLDVLLVWSDLAVSETIVDARAKNFTVDRIFTKPGAYRYLADEDNGFISEVPHNGNVPGIYFIKNTSRFFESTRNVHVGEEFDVVQRFEELLAEGVQVVMEEFPGEIMEFRDRRVYDDYMDKNARKDAVPRFFNEITQYQCHVDSDLASKASENRIMNLSPSDPIFKKKCTHPDFYPLTVREIEWYNTVDGKWVPPSFGNVDDQRLIPKLYDYAWNEDFGYWMKMEDLSERYKTLYHVVHVEGGMSGMLIRNVIDKIKELHDLDIIPVSKEQVFTDIKTEFLDKTVSRVKSVRNILYDVNWEDFLVTTTEAFAVLVKQFANRRHYSLIHGDTNGSNIMVAKEVKEYGRTFHPVKFIDPRGYFGTSELYGLPEYDFAKLAYFMSGYDEFNLSHYSFTRHNFDKPKGYQRSSLETRGPIIDLMVGLIWVNLSSYICNNVMKVNISYHHGMNLIKEAMANF